MHIVWQTKSEALRNALVDGSPDELAAGGRAYEFSAAMDLSKSWRVTADDGCVRRADESDFAYLCRTLAHPNRDADAVYVVDPFVLTLGKRTRAGRTISIVHHIDIELMRASAAWRMFFRLQIRRLRSVDKVVAVSEFWRDYLVERGCRNVAVIYNSFDTAEYDLRPAEVESFRLEHQIPLDKPLVYIGNARRVKGVVETYEALRAEPYTLVMSGPLDPDLQLPVLHLTLSHHDYLRLLAAADVVTTMSTMPEGWNRTAHEALLCRTPVVGSGTGGMRELLTKGGQLIAEDFSMLPALVQKALAESATRSEAGFRYASTLNSDYRREAWTSLVAELMNDLPPSHGADREACTS